MDFIRQFVQLNRELIYFGYGLVFFVLGLSIALRSRQSSRLDLARSLTWLSAFGFTHGFHEWGDLFIPIQAVYLPAGTVEFLHRIHLLLLAVSFTLLFQFGVSLLHPLGRARWGNAVATPLLAVWIFVVYFPLASLIPNFMVWHDTANALARYFIGFPAAIIAGYGLRQYTLKRIAPLNVPHIVRTLQFAGLMFGLYAFFAGLIPPPAPFFPADHLNSVAFESVMAVPPPVFRSIVGLGLALAIIRALEVFDLETARLIEGMEEQQILVAERERLGRELHDGAIQKVYTAGLLVQSAQKLVQPEGTDIDVLGNRLEKAVNVLGDAIVDLRRSLGDLTPTTSGEPLALALRQLVEDPRFHSLVDIHLDIDLPAGEIIPAPRTGHVLAITNEALSNVVRHSHAHHVNISARTIDGRFELKIEDDGISLPRHYQPGFGLRNMRDRARLLGGELEVTNLPGKGTLVSLNIPLKEERV